MANWAKQLFPVTDEDIQAVRTHFNKTKKEIDNDCEIIKTWMKSQSHFPKDYDKERVERFHLRNKFRIERTKEKLEKYYTARGENPRYFNNLDAAEDIIRTALTTMVCVPLPKMHFNLERVYLNRLTGNDHLFSIEQPIQLMYTLAELELVHDYSTGLRLIYDLKEISMAHYRGIDLNMAIKGYKLFTESLSGRILGIEIINAPSFMKLLLALLKMIFPPRLYKKIRIHDTLESLKTVVDEEYLPRDYGGKMKSSQELHEDLKNTLQNNKEYTLSRVYAVSDESKRLAKDKNNELFGVNGTFKKINLD